MDQTFRLLGLVGVTLYLSSYAQLQAGWLRGFRYVLGLLNVATARVLISLATDFNLSSAISRVTILVMGLRRVWVLTRNLHFFDVKATMIAAQFPTIRRLDERRLRNTGGRHVGMPGDLLTEQGRPVRQLS